MMSVVQSAGRGVTQVVTRCDGAKETGYLDLSSCQLMFIPDAIYLLLKGYEITKVNIQDNAMKKFPRKFVAKFPNATIINMANNEITEIPEEFGSWTSLKGVTACKNKMEVFPMEVMKLEKLIYLDLSGNEIKDLPVSQLYTSLPNLLKLNLSSNPLSEDVKSQLQSGKSDKLQLIL